MGRKRYLPDINSRNSVVRSYAERNAVNAPLQGSAADIIKIAMINIYRHMEEAGLRSRMIMQVHDELIFNVVPEELERLQQIVTADMSDAYHGRVPLEVSAGVGANWLEATKILSLQQILILLNATDLNYETSHFLCCGSSAVRVGHGRRSSHNPRRTLGICSGRSNGRHCRHHHRI